MKATRPPQAKISPERESRAAEALRENLHKRKAQQQAKQASRIGQNNKSKET